MTSRWRRVVVPPIVVALARDLTSAQAQGASIAILELGARDYRSLLAALGDLEACLCLEPGSWAVVGAPSAALARVTAGRKAALLAASSAAVDHDPSLVPVLHRLGIRGLRIQAGVTREVLAAAAAARMILWLAPGATSLLASIETLDRVVLEVTTPWSVEAARMVTAAGGTVYLGARDVSDAGTALDLMKVLNTTHVALGPQQVSAEHAAEALARRGAGQETIAALLGGHLVKLMTRFFEA